MPYQVHANMRPGWQPLLPQQMPRDHRLAQDGNLEQIPQQDTTVGHSRQTSNIMRNPLLNRATPGVPNISAPPLPGPPLLSQSARTTRQQHLHWPRPLATPTWHIHTSQHQGRPPGQDIRSQASGATVQRRALRYSRGSPTKMSSP